MSSGGRNDGAITHNYGACAAIDNRSDPFWGARDILTWRALTKGNRKPAGLEDLKEGIQYTPVDSIATVGHDRPLTNQPDDANRR